MIRITQMSKRFSKKNAQKYVVVHRPHDDPHFYDTDATEHILIPVDNPNQKLGTKKSEIIPKGKDASDVLTGANKHVGEAALYGIAFDDSKYDYTQHLKPIGTDPSNSFFISAKGGESGEKSIDDLFVEPGYGDHEESMQKNVPVFQRGAAKPEYLLHQQAVPEEISGFKPDMNPALREVLEALEDEAYVVNDDVVVQSAANKHQDSVNQGDDEDDLFAELLGSGEAQDDQEFEDQLDEWDIDNLGDYEEENYHTEMADLQTVDNLEDLKNIDYQADVRRFQKEQSQAKKNADTDDEFSDGNLESTSPEIENDTLGDLPTFDSKVKSSSKKRKDRRKKGAMSDVSGFSMTSSAIARTETMTVLDDKYDQIISGYENYQEEQFEEEDEYEPFDMKKERSDFESLLDDFLDNYELDTGGRKLVKKDEEVDRLKRAADEVSKGKLSQRRNRERNKNLNKVQSSLSGLHL